MNENQVKERMQKIAEMLGVQLNEEFNIIGEGKTLDYGPYKFTERGLLNKDDCRLDKKMAELIRGIYKIEKLQRKPKNGDEYYYVELWDIPTIETGRFDSENPYEIALYKCGWLFRTEAEAEANKERVLAEMREVISNE